METINRISFFADKTTVKEAKRKASLKFNKQVKPIDEFNYVTPNGTYVFTRRNIIAPNGFVKFGNWS